MERQESERRQAEAVREFNQHQNRGDGARVAAGLNLGLNVLRDLLYWRVHRDVERIVGADSMLMPVSEKKTERLTKTEIELYQIAESATAVRDHGYLGTDDDWYVRWLTLLRLGLAHTDVKIARRLSQYAGERADERRLAFTDVLSRVVPESRRAPLVLFQLLPLAVQIVTAQAFDDGRRASELRSEQIQELAAIADCPQCHGRVLENGQECHECGNPLWKFRWLTEAD